MSILRAAIAHTMDTTTVLKVVDQRESPERNKIENDIQRTRHMAGFLLYF